LKSSKKKYKQQKTQCRVLRTQVVQARIREACAKGLLDIAIRERDLAQQCLKDVERAIEDCVGTQHAAVLGVKTVDGPEHLEELRQPICRPILWDEPDTPLSVRTRVLKKIQVQEVQDAIDVIAIRIVDMTRGLQAHVKFPITYFASVGWQNVGRVRETMAVDMARALIERMR